MWKVPSLISSTVIGMIAASVYGIPGVHAQSTAVTIDRIEVRLFLERSGVLSENVAPPAAPVLWNTIIGEGDAKEPAHDFLVLVSLSGPPNKFLNQPLVVTVARVGDMLKRPIVERRFETLLFGPNGKLTKPVFMTNATCNTAKITASTGTIGKSTSVEFRCGE
jgi:hypothetical protein